MRPSTTRRTLVFVVCLVGVAALYGVPTAVRTPQRLGLPAAPPAPVVSAYEPSPTTPARTHPTEPATTAPAAGGDDRPSDPPSEPTPATVPTGSPTVAEPSAEPRADSTSAAATTAPPTEVPVSVGITAPTSSTTVTDLPGRVHRLRLVESDHEGLVVAWNPVRGATAYQIVLNGYPVGGTTGTEVALRWFNDDMSQHYVQVRAIGSDGQRSEDAAYLPVTRPADPTPDPTEPTPSPTATGAGQEPTPTPSATR